MTGTAVLSQKVAQCLRAHNHEQVSFGGHGTTCHNIQSETSLLSEALHIVASLNDHLPRLRASVHGQQLLLISERTPHC